jgi:SAM-dependent methyltransferase
MTAQNAPADPRDFPAVDSSGDPAAMIALMDVLAPLHRVPKSLLLDRLAPETARAALDVGCGPGTDAVELARRMPPGSSVEGVDVSEAMLAEARRRALAAGVDVMFRAGREAGLTGVTVDPGAYTANHQAARAIFGPVVTRLRGQGALTPEQADDWWSWLDRQDAAGGYTFGATVFVVTGTRAARTA